MSIPGRQRPVELRWVEFGGFCICKCDLRKRFVPGLEPASLQACMRGLQPAYVPCGHVWASPLCHTRRRSARACVVVRPTHTQHQTQGAATQQDHYLLHGGQPLDEGRTLADYSIQHQDTLQLLLRLRCVSEVQPRLFGASAQVTCSSRCLDHLMPLPHPRLTCCLNTRCSVFCCTCMRAGVA